MTKRKQGAIPSLTDGNKDPQVKIFVLERTEDVSGNSGTGVVASGCLFPSGQCVVSFISVIHSLTIYQSIADLEKIHGHDGKTKIRYLN